MALPEIKLPSGLPFFLAQDHAIELEPVFDDQVRLTGLTRRRRLRTRAHRLQTVSLLLKADEAAAFWDWYERDLRAGALPFSAQIADESGVAMYWRAEWVEPPHAIGMHLGRWRITGRLRLGFDEPTVDGPTRSSFEAKVFVGLRGAAVVSVQKMFQAEVAAGLTGAANLTPESRSLAAEIVVGMN